MLFKESIMKNRIIAFLAVALLSWAGSEAQGELYQNQYSDYLSRAESQLGFSGSVLVVKNDSILVAYGYGLANRETFVQNTPDTKFLLCSATKPFTATAVMQLAERELLSLDDPITKYLTGYTDSTANSITVYHLLTQTSGIPDYLSLIDSNQSFSEPVSVDHVTSRIIKAPREFEPGLKWQYSNSNYYLLGKIIELASGLSYGEYMEKNIFAPLEMNNSGFPDSYLNDLPESATGGHLDGRGDLVAAAPVHSSWPFAAGGLYSTIDDMVKWENGLRDGSLITPKSTSKMFTPFKWRYACGWEIDTLYGMLAASHGGTGGGFCSILIRFIDYPLCVVVLSNNEDAFRKVSKIGYDLVAMAVGKSPETESGEQLAAVDPEILKEYAGEYELAPGIVLTFIHREGRLFTCGPGQPEVEIYPRSETVFFMKVVEGSVKFVRDSLGSVSGIIVQQGGRNISANRMR